MDYHLIRSRRKTLAIHIVTGGKIEVRAPLGLSIKEIERFLLKKEQWIYSQIEKIVTRETKKAQFKLSYGSFIPLFGDKVEIRPKMGKRCLYDEVDFYLPYDLTADQIKTACIRLYKQIAKSYLTKRTQELAAVMGVAPSKIQVGSAKTRWGSCSGDKSIRYTWRLVMADKRIIDYVIVHELAHIYQMNHSPRFWAIVGHYLPDYQQRQKELKQFQKELATQNWDSVDD